MAITTVEQTRQKSLRLWPGVAAVFLQWFTRFAIPVLWPEAMLLAVAGGLLGGLAVVVWWAFFSRAPRPERWGAIVLMVVALAATPRILHESMATAGQGVLFFIYAIPVLSLAFVAWAVASQHLSDRARRATMVVTIFVACGVWALVRTGGITGNADSDFAWRWSPTPEERLLARAGEEPSGLPSAPAATPTMDTGAGWPGFRGPDRDSVVRGLRIATDWSASPPVELWRRPIGPGWSSFAVRGDLLYTQEQRGDDEVVSAYRASTGEPVWQHRDVTRFWESNGGAGPRATPTLSGGRVYAFGATGILNALDAGSGAVVWSRNVASDTDVDIPGWGFASSPQVAGDIVIVAAAGRLAAYDVDSGELRWLGPDGGGGYSSPHLLAIDGVTQVLLLSGSGASGFAPADGTLLWEHSWPGSPIVQPAVTADGDILINTADASGGIGLRRIALAHGPDGWTLQERWTSRGLKPYFNDFVVHGGHAFGFDGSILACIDVETGERTWKGGRYGHGQLLLLPDRDLLLVLSEDGELALVAAAADKFTELARFPALEGKTWNHPVLVGDILLVRNGQEMAAFRLPIQEPDARSADGFDEEHSVEDVRALAQRYTAAWNSGEPGNVAAFFAENGSLKVNDAEPAVGRAAITEVARGFMTAFPDMVLSFDRLEPAGDRANFHWTYGGTNTGPGGTGRRVRFSGYESWRLGADGLIADSLGSFDADEYARQLEHGVESYLYVWAGDPDEGDSDFLAVIDASPDSDRFGEVLSTIPVGASAGAHHSEHVMPAGGHLVVNGFAAGRSWVVDVEDPLHPAIAATFEGAGPYTSPHSFERTPAGNILATFQYREDNTDAPGGLVELDPMGNFLRGSDAADAADPELRPYSLAIAPELDRVVTTTSDMSMQHEGRSVQIWSLGELELLHTLLLPPGPQGDEHLNPAEPRFLPDGSAIVNTFNCGIYLLTAIGSEDPQVELIGSLPRDPGGDPGASECSLPVLFKNYWVQTADPSNSMVVFDISDPRDPLQVDELSFGGDARPHWLSLERGTNRIVMTGGGERLQGMVVLLEIDPRSGKLSLVEHFGADGELGLSMRRESWPHGSSGPAIPHGAVFSR